MKRKTRHYELRDIGIALGLSHERIRQLEVSGLEKMRAELLKLGIGAEVLNKLCDDDQEYKAHGFDE